MGGWKTWCALCGGRIRIDIEPRIHHNKEVTLKLKVEVSQINGYEQGTGGQQSASVAFLDATRTGTVVTAIQGRDYARIYGKELDRGRSSVALSPEEQEAVERAMGRA